VTTPATNSAAVSERSTISSAVTAFVLISLRPTPLRLNSEAFTAFLRISDAPIARFFTSALPTLLRGSSIAA
jgi:hypothetical protein